MNKEKENINQESSVEVENKKTERQVMDSEGWWKEGRWQGGVKEGGEVIYDPWPWKRVTPPFPSPDFPQRPIHLCHHHAPFTPYPVPKSWIPNLFLRVGAPFWRLLEPWGTFDWNFAVVLSSKNQLALLAVFFHLSWWKKWYLGKLGQGELW